MVKQKKVPWKKTGRKVRKKAKKGKKEGTEIENKEGEKEVITNLRKKARKR
jgi:hypothetical protein